MKSKSVDEKAFLLLCKHFSNLLITSGYYKPDSARKIRDTFRKLAREGRG